SFFDCYNNVVKNYEETIKLFLPAAIYAVQNNLYFIALRYLEPMTYYVLRILLTALMLWIMLDRRFSWQQLFALMLLAFGVAIVEIQITTIHENSSSDQNSLLGFNIVLIICFTSAFAGVYMEKIFKQSSVSIWIQNIRLNICTLIIICPSICLYNYSDIVEGNMLRGFDYSVWLLILLSSAGGLLISFVIKYADSTTKIFVQVQYLTNTASKILYFCLTIILSIFIYYLYPFQNQGKEILRNS
ncbi:unnamed protein product, partial [Thelazia callipaeda]|uniref:UDP-sugar transporter protein SLC35A4 (Trinotate prediction) n=1 Tax=Thelazia callipaeda TaxID=103827 RepID=A0A0N5D8V8_THECL